jgi:polyisoprenyl-phosphate glycosyltransferase
MPCEQSRPHLSIVLPTFNEEANVRELHRRVSAALAGMGIEYEIVFVNDGSTDRTWPLIREVAEQDPQTRALNLSRNFGHQVAITAGLDSATGGAVVVMDSDLQDPPEVIPHLYAKFLEGYDVVYGQRSRRDGETFLKLATAKAFYRIVRRLTTLDIPVDTGEFRLISRRVVDDLKRFPEQHRYLRGLVTWVGYDQVAVLYDRDRRYGGSTKFSMGRMIVFALDGITSLSIRPLRLASHIGLLLSLASFLAMMATIIYKLVGGRGLIPGWTSLFVAALFIGGIQLLALGLLGEYIGRIHEQVKNRPMYLVRDRVNIDGSTVECGSE